MTIKKQEGTKCHLIEKFTRYFYTLCKILPFVLMACFFRSPVNRIVLIFYVNPSRKCFALCNMFEKMAHQKNVNSIGFDTNSSAEEIDQFF